LVVPNTKDRFARERMKMGRQFGIDQFRHLAPLNVGGSRRFVPFIFASAARRTTPRSQQQRQRPTGELDASIVQRLVRTYVVPKARQCYQRALRSNHTLSGALTLEVELARGEVQTVSIRGSLTGQKPPGAVEQCVEEAAYAIQVPRVAQGSDVESVGVAKYPLTFRVVDKKGEVSGGRRTSKDHFNPDDPLDGL
jgi:hypothetical protein